MKKCPHCSEEIKEEAIKCRYCRGSLENSLKLQKDSVEAKEVPVDSVNKKNYFNGVVSVVVFIVMFFFAKYIVQNGVSYFLSDKDSETTIEEALTQASVEISKDLPTMVDEITQLTSVSSVGKDLIYSYKISTDNSISQYDLDNSLKSSVINEVCTTSETKDLLDKNAGLIYNYYAENGDYIGKISVHSIDCK